MRTPIPTHLNTFVRDATSWPSHKKRNKARKRLRKKVTAKAQAERDARLLQNPSK